jgi:hypothetical protein
VIGLPGFDAWLTRTPEDGPEPSQSDYDDARAELGPDATDDEIDAAAWRIMESGIERARLDAEEAEADSRRDDWEREL